MLVLSRKQGEQVRIGDAIVLTIKRIDSHQVRLGIEAPPELKILRGELAPQPRPASFVETSPSV